MMLKTVSNPFSLIFIRLLKKAIIERNKSTYIELLPFHTGSGLLNHPSMSPLQIV